MHTRTSEPTEQPGSADRGYKKNWAKWVGLYLLIGGMIYLIIYLVAFHHGGGAGGGGY
jgi:hypothetical protein